jgi:3-methyladenine DNA glycosylase/8-oxoguanine DNA glycosylase
VRSRGRSPAFVEVEVRPPWPYRLPLRLGRDGVARRRGGVVSRLLDVAGRAVVVHVWQPAARAVRFRAAPVDDGDAAARSEELELAVERMRFAVGVDECLDDFYDAFRVDPLVGPAIRRRPWHRPRRRPWPWEALAWAITEQLIEGRRAAQIQRRIVARWGAKQEPCAAWEGPGPLRGVPDADSIADCAPAELAAMDLSPARSLALIRCAREVAAGRAQLDSPAGDPRLRRISEIGPWTLQCLGFHGRGDPDSLPAGDLAYVKLVGDLARLGRRATVEEVEEFFAPYAPFRGLAGSFALAYWAKAMGAGPPAALRPAA